MKRNLLFVSIIPSLLLTSGCSISYDDFNEKVSDNEKIDNLEALKEKYDECIGTIKYNYEETDSTDSSSNIKFDYTYNIRCKGFYKTINLGVIDLTKNYENKTLVSHDYLTSAVYYYKEINTISSKIGLKQEDRYKQCTPNYYSSAGGLYCTYLKSSDERLWFYGWTITDTSNKYTNNVESLLNRSLPKDVGIYDDGFNKVTVFKSSSEYKIQIKSNTGDESYEYRYNTYGCLTYYNYSFKSEESLIGATRTITKKETFKANYTTKKE